MTLEPITVVSGLPRSGTSLAMQMLEAGGFPLLADQQRQPDPSNPRGYFEFEPVKRLRVDTTWLESARGRAVKIIHLLLMDLPTDGRFTYRVLFIRRPLQEVLSSQEAMLQRHGKNAADADKLGQVYAQQLDQVQQWLTGHHCFTSLDLHYHDVLAEPRAAAMQIQTFLGFNLNVETMAAAVAPDLCHHQSETPAA
ncbi:MAG: sulfotransferase family protein [Chthoniobacterales bacterium]